MNVANVYRSGPECLPPATSPSCNSDRPDTEWARQRPFRRRFHSSCILRRCETRCRCRVHHSNPRRKRTARHDRRFLTCQSAEDPSSIAVELVQPPCPKATCFAALRSLPSAQKHSRHRSERHDRDRDCDRNLNQSHSRLSPGRRITARLSTISSPSYVQACKPKQRSQASLAE